MKPKKETEPAEPTEVQEIRALIAAIPEVLVDRTFMRPRQPTGEVTVRAGDGPIIATFPIDERAATRVDGVAIANAFCGIRWIAAKALGWHRDLHTACAMYEARIAQQAQEIERIDALAQELLVERDEARAGADAQRAEHVARMYCITGWGVNPPIPQGWRLVDHDGGGGASIQRWWPAGEGSPNDHLIAITIDTDGAGDWAWTLHENGAAQSIAGGGASTLAAAMAAGEAAVKARREAIAALDSAPVP